MRSMIGWPYPERHVDGMALAHATAKDKSRNIAIFGFVWSKTATKSNRAQGAWSFLATLHRTVAKKRNVLRLAKPKVTTIPISLSFLTTFLGLRARRCRNLQRDVAKKGCAIDLDLALRSFLATHECGCRWRIALVVGKGRAARYNYVLRAYGAPSAVEPCPAGQAGRFAPPPEIWRP